MGMVLKVVGGYQEGCDLTEKLFMANQDFWDKFASKSLSRSSEKYLSALNSILVVRKLSNDSVTFCCTIKSVLGDDDSEFIGAYFYVNVEELKKLTQVTYEEEVQKVHKTNAKKFLTSSLLGRSFKGIPLKLIGNAGMKLPERLKVIDQFKGCEFLLKRTSNKYIYGFPVGHPDKVMAFDFGSVKFYHDGQDFDDCEPNVSFFHMIKGNLAGYNISEIQE